MSMIGHNNKPAISLDGLSDIDRKVLRKAVLELNDSMTRADAEREVQRDIIAEINDRLGVDKKLVRRMARAYFKANFSKEIEDNNSFESFYEAVMQKTAS